MIKFDMYSVKLSAPRSFNSYQDLLFYCIQVDGLYGVDLVFTLVTVVKDEKFLSFQICS